MFGSLRISLLFWGLTASMIIFLLRQTGWLALALCFIGDNRDACELSGIRVWWVVPVTYATRRALRYRGPQTGLGCRCGQFQPRGRSFAALGRSCHRRISISAVGGGYAGDEIIGALILMVLKQASSRWLDVPGNWRGDSAWRDHPPARHSLYKGAYRE